METDCFYKYSHKLEVCSSRSGMCTCWDEWLIVCCSAETCGDDKYDQDVNVNADILGIAHKA